MATEYDIIHAASGIYAQSLLELACEGGQEDGVGEELKELRALWDREQAFSGLMSSTAIDVDARAGTLKKVFSGRVSPLIYNLLMVLNAKGRSVILPALCDEYARRLDERRGRSRAYVTSAAALDDAQRGRLREQLKRLIDREPVLIERVDAELLGGLTVQVADRVYDFSVRRRLRDLRGELLASIEGHIRGGVGRFLTP